MRVERTDFVSVPVTDMQRSTRFYEETLGLELTPGGFPEFRIGAWRSSTILTGAR